MKKYAVIFGDDPRLTTGFAKVVDNLVIAAEQSGLSPIVVGIKDFVDGQQEYRCPVYNALCVSAEKSGETTLEIVLRKYSPHVVLSVGDPWDMGFFHGMKEQFPFYWIAYVPVESAPFPAWIPAGGTPGKYFEVCKLLSLADHIVAYTKFGAEAIGQAFAEYNALADKKVSARISQVYHGVDTDFFKPMDRKKARKYLESIGVKSDDILFTVIKANSIRAGFDTLLDAWAVYLNTMRKQDAVIAEKSKLYIHTFPDGPAFPLPAMTHHYGSTGTVALDRSIVLGQGCSNERLRDIYNSTDVFLSTSRGEGFGLPVAEAMACSVPVIVPNIGGPTEFVKDGGYIIPIIATYQPEFLYTKWGIVSAVGMAEKMIELAKNKSARGKMGIAGRKEISAFSWGKFHVSFVTMIKEGVSVVDTARNDMFGGIWV